MTMCFLLLKLVLLLFCGKKLMTLAHPKMWPRKPYHKRIHTAEPSPPYRVYKKKHAKEREHALVCPKFPQALL